MDSDADIWSKLPRDLLSRVSKCLPDRVDKIRFRGVCSSWRSSVPAPPSLNSLVSSVRIPTHEPDSSRSFLTMAICPKYYLQPATESSYLTLATCPVYYLQPIMESFHKGTIVKVNELGDGKLQALQPLSQWKIFGCPKVIDLSKFRVYELTHLYYLQGHPNDGSELRFNVALSTKNGILNLDETSLMGISKEALVHFKLGGEKWSIFGKVVDGFFNFEDVVYYEGKFYAADGVGSVHIFDSDMNVEVLQSPVVMDRLARYLLDSCGLLYLIVGKTGGGLFDTFLSDALGQSRVWFRVFSLDKTQKTWKPVNELDSRAFFVGQCSSFAVDVSGFPAFRRNSIYFTRLGNSSRRGDNDMGIFNMETGQWGWVGYGIIDTLLQWPPNC